MPFAIVRVAKLKSGAQIAQTCMHNFREQVPYYAKQKHLGLRQVSLFDGSRSASEAVELYKSKLPEKVRKDAVHAFEVIVSIPPEWKAEKDDEQYKKMVFEYLGDAAKWLVGRFGGIENLVSSNLHDDERTPHMHLVVMPLRDGKLNAKSYLNGPADLRQFQTDFAEQVGKKYSLDRGVPKARTGRHHLDHKEYHHIADQAVKMALEQKEREIQNAVQRRGRKI